MAIGVSLEMMRPSGLIGEFLSYAGLVMLIAGSILALVRRFGRRG